MGHSRNKAMAGLAALFMLAAQPLPVLAQDNVAPPASTSLDLIKQTQDLINTFDTATPRDKVASYLQLAKLVKSDPAAAGAIMDYADTVLQKTPAPDQENTRYLAALYYSAASHNTGYATRAMNVLKQIAMTDSYALSNSEFSVQDDAVSFIADIARNNPALQVEAVNFLRIQVMAGRSVEKAIDGWRSLQDWYSSQNTPEIADAVRILSTRLESHPDEMHTARVLARIGNYYNGQAGTIARAFRKAAEQHSPVFKDKDLVSELMYMTIQDRTYTTVTLEIAMADALESRDWPTVALLADKLQYLPAPLQNTRSYTTGKFAP